MIEVLFRIFLLASCVTIVWLAPYYPYRSQKEMYLRSALPYPYEKPLPYYNPWQAWKNRILDNTWKRTWPNVPQPRQPQVSSWLVQNPAITRQIASAPSPAPASPPQQPWLGNTQPNPWASALQQNGPATEQQTAVQYSGNTQSSQWSNTLNQEVEHNPGNVRSFFGQHHSTCEQCNGDCRNYLCYGCGGCQEPPPEQQTYYYPYQRQDAAYHDAFIGNEMALSGLVIWPAPKVPKSWKLTSKKSIERSKVASKDDDDNDDDGDDEDGDGDDDDDDDDDNDVKSKSKTKSSKKYKRDIY